MSAVQTAIPFDDHRTTPIGATGSLTQFLRQSGVDFLWLWDELSGWFPRSLWVPEVTPMAAVMDGDSTYDPFIQAAFALAADPALNVRLSTDAIRNGPPELMRKLYTLQSATEGQVTLALGAGELRQTRPFGFGVWLFAVVHEDPELVARALENPLVKYFAGQFGRLDAAEWRELGHTPVMPEGWHYAIKWVPFSQSAEDVNDVVARTTTAMARDAFICGGPAEVAARANAFVDAGATFVGIADMLPLALGPEYAQASLGYAAQISAVLKGVEVPV